MSGYAKMYARDNIVWIFIYISSVCGYTTVKPYGIMQADGYQANQYPWIISDITVEINDVQLPTTQDLYNNYGPPLYMNESLKLDKHVSMFYNKTIKLYKSFPRKGVHNISVMTSSGKVRWTVNQTPDILIVKVTIVKPNLPLRLWMNYELHNAWQRTHFPQDINPFPLYTQPFTDFAGYWAVRTFFDFTFSKTLKIDSITLIDKHVTFMIHSTHTELYSLANIFRMEAALTLNSSSLGELHKKCLRNTTQAFTKLRCSIDEMTGKDDIVQLVLFYSELYPYAMPEQCIEGYISYIDYIKSHTIHTPNIEWIIQKYKEHTCIVYLVMITLSCFTCSYGIHIEREELSKSNAAQHKFQYVKQIVYLCFCCLVHTCADTSYRFTMESCRLLYVDHNNNYITWYVNVLLLLLYPIILLLIILYPFYTYANNMLQYYQPIKYLPEYLDMKHKKNLHQDNENNYEFLKFDVTDIPSSDLKSPFQVPSEFICTSEKPVVTSHPSKKYQCVNKDEHHHKDFDWYLLYILHNMRTVSVLFAMMISLEEMLSGVAPFWYLNIWIAAAFLFLVLIKYPMCQK